MKNLLTSAALTFFIGWTACQVAAGAASQFEEWLTAESVEMCHRQAGSNSEVCGPLPR